MLLDTVDTTEGNQIGNASGDDTQTDEPGQRSACNVRILEAEETEDDAKRIQGKVKFEFLGLRCVIWRFLPFQMSKRDYTVIFPVKPGDLQNLKHSVRSQPAAHAGSC